LLAEIRASLGCDECSSASGRSGRRQDRIFCPGTDFDSAPGSQATAGCDLHAPSGFGGAIAVWQR
jgi:hypothetical protein